MHELSIALSIVDIASDAVRNAGATVVEEIELEIGDLAGIEIPALEFAWSEAVRGSVLEHARRTILRVRGESQCLECGEVFPADAMMAPCPACGSPFSDVRKGKELRVHALTVH